MKNKRLSARMLSLALSAMMAVATVPANAFAAGKNSILPEEDGPKVIVSFDQLDDRFEPSTGVNASSHIYALTVPQGTPFEELQLPEKLAVKISRDMAQDEPSEEDDKQEESKAEITEDETEAETAEAIEPEESEAETAEDETEAETAETVEPEESETSTTESETEVETTEAETTEAEVETTESETVENDTAESETEVETTETTVSETTEAETEPETVVSGDSLDDCETVSAFGIAEGNFTPLSEGIRDGKITDTTSESIPVEWNSNKTYSSEKKGGPFIYTAELPEGYNLDADVKLPQIYVFVGKQARTAAEEDRTLFFKGDGKLYIGKMSGSNVPADEDLQEYTEQLDKWSVSGDTLTLEGLTFETSGRHSLWVLDDAKLVLEEGSVNTFTTSHKSGRALHFMAEDVKKINVDISGGGTLKVSGFIGIYMVADLAILDTTFEVKGVSRAINSYCDATGIPSSAVITDSSITAVATSDYSSGIYFDMKSTINIVNSTINTKSSGSAYTLMASGGLSVDEGLVIIGTADGTEPAAGNAAVITTNKQRIVTGDDPDGKTYATWVKIYPNKEKVEITADAAAALIYSGQPQAGVTKVSVSDNKIPADELVYTYTGRGNTEYEKSTTAPTNAGDYTVTLSVSDDNETFMGKSEAVDFTIGKKSVTVRPKDYSIKTGAAMPAFELLFDGIVNGETLTVTPSPTFDCLKDGVAVDGQTAGSYPVTWKEQSEAVITDGTGKTANYNITKSATGTLAVSSNGGGGSSSSGGSSSRGAIWTSLPPAYTGGTRIIGNVRVPDYTVEGNWKRNENGTWNFTGSAGQIYANSWAPVFNPYADVTKGQSAFDWFLFDANGTMRTGWYTDVDGNTYYLNPNSDNTLGAMRTGWVLIDEKYYYFNEKSDGTRGKLFKNARTPDGYLVNENGVRIGA